jgi:hypothetical protein
MSGVGEVRAVLDPVSVSAGGVSAGGVSAGSRAVESQVRDEAVLPATEFP